MSRNPTLSYVLCSVPPLLNCNTKESMWDLWMKYLCPRDFRRGEMEEKMKQMIGYCGLNCERCDAYLATVRDDRQLREKTAKLWAELNHAPILPEHINCLGCRMDGVKTVFCESMCGIRQCARKKGVATCGDCPELEACSIVGTILANDPFARKNLKGQIQKIWYPICQVSGNDQSGPNPDSSLWILDQTQLRKICGTDASLWGWGCCR